MTDIVYFATGIAKPRRKPRLRRLFSFLKTKQQRTVALDPMESVVVRGWFRGELGVKSALAKC